MTAGSRGQCRGRGRRVRQDPARPGPVDVPEPIKRERSEHGLARNFVFTHLFGPALAQAISIFLYRTDPRPGIECWVIILTICSFWLLPFILRVTRNLQFVALLSIQLLAFASLYGLIPLRRRQFALHALADRRPAAGLLLLVRPALPAALGLFVRQPPGVLRRRLAVRVPGAPVAGGAGHGRAGSRSSRRRSTCRGWRSTTPASSRCAPTSSASSTATAPRRPPAPGQGNGGARKPRPVDLPRQDEP